MKKGQISVEAIVIFSLLLVLVVFILLVYGSRFSEIQREKELSGAQQLADRIATRVNGVYLLGDNATADLYFPNTLAGTNYNVTFGEHFVGVYSTTFVATAPTISPLNVSISLPSTHALGTTHTFTLAEGNVTIQ